MRVLAALVIWWLGCAKPASVPCSFGTCPSGTSCDDIHEICATREQIQQCDGQDDLTRCTAALGGGRCDRGVCVPACGDTILNSDEQCDDGDLESHDGCSSICTDEVPTWTLWESGWVGRSSHAAAYAANRMRLVVHGGLAADGTRNDVWERDAAGTWHRGPPGPALYDTGMVFDAARNVIVLFGGRDLNGTLPSGATWEYDGTSWTQRAPAASPSPRHSHAMVYDAANQRTVLFGGRPDNTNTWLGDTWSYDGNTWTPITSMANPIPRSSTMVAYDELRGRIVLFGGLAGFGRGDTWELVGNEWTNIPGAGPPPRHGGGIAYSPARQAVVLFGGHYHPNDMPLSDTWEYTSTGWELISLGINPPGRRRMTLTQDANGSLALVGGYGLTGSTEAFDDVWDYTCAGSCTPTTAAGSWVYASVALSPTPRSRAPVVHDTTRDELVVFGGLSNAAPNGSWPDTWRFVDGFWTRATPGQSPSPRRDHAAAYDSKRDRVVIAAGATGNDVLVPTLVPDTWEWDGQQWTLGPSGLPARSGATMAYHADDEVIVLYGGRDAANMPLLETWELANGTWTPVASASSPPCCGEMVYDERAKRLVYVEAGETWTYDDHAWTSLGASDTPQRSAFALGYDARRGAAMMFGGRSTDGATHADLWELVGDAWREVQVPPGPSAVYDPSLSQRGSTAGLLLFGGYTGAQYVGETWLFAYQSDLPDEVCTGGADDDGDGAVDCVDEDCAYATACR